MDATTNNLIVPWSDLQQLRETIERGSLDEADSQLESMLDAAPVLKTDVERFGIPDPATAIAGAREALGGMLREFGNQKMNVRKDYHKLVQVEAARTALAQLGDTPDKQEPTP